MSVDCELRPIVQLLVDDLSRRFRHQPERISGKVNQRLAIFAEREVKFFPELTQRILRIELKRELFVSGKCHRHKSATNVQRSTPNVQRRIQKNVRSHAMSPESRQTTRDLPFSLWITLFYLCTFACCVRSFTVFAVQDDSVYGGGCINSMVVP